MIRNRNMYYILSGHDVVPIGSVELWGQWFETADRRVDYTEVGSTEISTVFLGMDHLFSDDGPPEVFETMIFGGPLSDSQWRYSTWEQAEEGHAKAVQAVKAAG